MCRLAQEGCRTAQDLVSGLGLAQEIPSFLVQGLGLALDLR